MTDDQMPDVFDRLTEQVGRWAISSHPSSVLSSDRTTCTDPAGRVQVTMKDFAIVDPR